ncbi:MAG: choice-of-anchor D domain-containing protein, partial [Deltaproteobacteria bacterium]|nr:choice-of-anchor D domain-containing protein [Deltaproteobacteria bacterium]
MGKKSIPVLLVLVCLAVGFNVPSPSYAQWAKTYGGSQHDQAYSIHQTTDGGYIVAGQTLSFGASGSSDVWVLKLDQEGEIVWQKTYGDIYYDMAYSVEETFDESGSPNGYVVAGQRGSSPEEGTGVDLWVLRLDLDGNVVWQKTYGGENTDEAFSIQQTTDGGYMVGGLTFSFGAERSDSWVLKLDSDGQIVWQRTFGGARDDYASCVRETFDSTGASDGYVVAGETNSFGPGAEGVWVIKLNPDGTVAWQKSYGGDNYEYARSIRQTTDGGYIVAGGTTTFGAGGPPESDFWVLKLDPTGGIMWQKSCGGEGDDRAHSICQTEDGGYIVAGKTWSFGDYHWLILKLDQDGNISWQKAYVGYGSGRGCSVEQTADRGYIVGGGTGYAGDLLVMKLDSYGEIPYCQAVGTSEARVFDTPGVDQVTTAPGASSPAAPLSPLIAVGGSSAEVSVVCGPHIEVSPLGYDFGNVELGSSATVLVGISNLGSIGLSVDSIAFQDGSSSDFSIASGPGAPTEVPPGETLYVEVMYTPSSLGTSSAHLEIKSDDSAEPTVVVTLSGTGLETEIPPGEQVAEILEFFDESVEN